MAINSDSSYVYILGQLYTNSLIILECSTTTNECTSQHFVNPNVGSSDAILVSGLTMTSSNTVATLLEYTKASEWPSVSYQINIYQVSSNPPTDQNISEPYLCSFASDTDDFGFIPTCCDNRPHVILDESVTYLSEYAFSGCTSLQSITIPSSVIDISYGAFAECSSLTSVTIPSSVIYISDIAFFNCTSLTSVTIPTSVTTIGTVIIFYCYYHHLMSYLITR